MAFRPVHNPGRPGVPMPRLLPFAVLGLLIADPPHTPIPPKTVTLRQPSGTVAAALADVQEQTGLTVELPADVAATPISVSIDRVPFWQAIEQIADRTGTRIALRERGRRVSLVKRNTNPEPSSVEGPFRVAATMVEARRDLTTGTTSTDVTLDLHWEPRFPVFRVDVHPTLTAVSDDHGSTITAAGSRGKTPSRGFLHTTSVRLTGVPRSATTLTRLAGTFTVTAAERMLPFVFDNLTTTETKELEGITVTLHPARRISDLWEFRVELTYPPSDIVFESFESWVTENRLRLTGPQGRTAMPTDFDVPEQGRRVVAVYRFPAVTVANPKDWTATYETPSALVEYPIAFDLKSIPLP